MSFIRQHKGAVVWSVMLHVAVVAAVLVGVPWRLERPPVQMAAAVPIEGVIIDQAAIERERDKREEAARQERARVQREERQRQQAQEQQRLEEQREQQRIADERRARAEAEQRERDRVAAEQRRAEEQAKAAKEAQERRAREEAERLAQQQAEARRRQQAEAELQAQAAAEAAANARALEQYMALIEEDVRRSWNRPLSAVPGLVCVVDVVQAPTGDVLTARVNPRQCNGDEAVRRSVEDAVRDASPLPKPPIPSVFSRTFTLTFAPDQ